MRVGLQFSGTVPGRSSRRWFTHSWNPAWHVVWTVVPRTVGAGGPQIEWDVAVERTSATATTYWITIRYVSPSDVEIEARFEVLN